MIIELLKHEQVLPHHSLIKDQSRDTREASERTHTRLNDTFALFPGQVAEVLDGHQLKSNEYLIIRVYNEVAAKENLKQTIAKATDEAASKKTGIKESDISIGKLFVIKGTDFSFYIPPTGIEVLKNEEGKFVQDAVTLERLEYCILLDQNGGKRYVQGPSVVFPAPTEKFVNRKGNKIFKAIELTYRDWESY